MKNHPNKIQLTVTLIILVLFSLALQVQVGFGASTNPEDPAAPDIVGGILASPGKWPWHVALIDSATYDAYWGYICGGALIHPEWVVTAGHCVQDEISGRVTRSSEIKILVGTTKLNTTDGTRLNVSQVIPHPNFLSEGDKDIALIRLSQPAVLSNLVQTIPLVNSPVSSLIAPGTPAVVTGWGLTSTWAFLWKEDLREVTVPIVSNPECQKSYDDMGTDITDNIICAGDTGQDACFFDSGGPMVVSNGVNNGYELAGIVSFGHDDGCGAVGRYGGYTRAPAFLDWVNSQTGLAPITFKVFLSLIIR